MNTVYAIVVLGVLGALFGLVLAVASKAFDGFPIALVTAGLIALAFMGFSGLKVW